MPITKVYCWWYSVSTEWAHPYYSQTYNRFHIPITIRGTGDGAGSARIPVYYEVEDSAGLTVATGSQVEYVQYSTNKVSLSVTPARKLVDGETLLVKVFAMGKSGSGVDLASEAIYAKLIVNDKWIKITGDEYNYSGELPTPELTGVVIAEPATEELPTDIPMPTTAPPAEPSNGTILIDPIPPDTPLYTGVPVDDVLPSLPNTTPSQQPSSNAGSGIAILGLIALAALGLH